MLVQIYEQRQSYATELAPSITFGNSIQTLDSPLDWEGFFSESLNIPWSHEY